MTVSTSQRARADGFTLLELVVVIMLIGTLLVVALSKLAGYVREAERVAVLTLEGELRNTLVLEAAKRILDRDRGGLLTLEHSNPMRLVLETPVNYVGEIDAEAARGVGRRHWFFDTDQRQLVYRRSDLDDDRGEALPDLRYDVRVAYEDRNGDGRYRAADDELLGVRLHRLSARSP